MAENRHFLRACSALVASSFALAQNLRKREKGAAFQASSPKTFRVGPRAGPFFSPLVIPAKAGIYGPGAGAKSFTTKTMDPGLRRDGAVICPPGRPFFLGPVV
jgi:hypothetical protein